MASLTGRVALVTGAAHPKGIGRAILNKLESEGAVVIGCDLAGADGLEDIGGLGCDVTNPSEVEAAIQKVVGTHGKLDIVVNNAGVGVGDADFMAINDAAWDLSLSVNVKGVANVCKAAIPHLTESGGVIINISSLAGMGALPAIPACYTASKFAVIGLTKSLALQYASTNIRVNAVCPGSIKTQLHAKSLALLAEEEGVSIEEAQALEDAAIPLGYSAEASEVGAAVCYLASDAAAYVTGTVLPVAGGMSPGL